MSISFFLPITGSILPSRAFWVKSVPYCATDLSSELSLFLPRSVWVLPDFFDGAPKKLPKFMNESSSSSSSKSAGPLLIMSSSLLASLGIFTPIARKMRIARQSLDDITARSMCSLPARESSPFISMDSSKARSIMCLVRGV